jgi:hypothetical protein
MSAYPNRNCERSNNYAQNQPSDNSHPKVKWRIASVYITLPEPRRSVSLAGSDRVNGNRNHRASAQEKRNDVKRQKFVGGVHDA